LSAYLLSYRGCIGREKRGKKRGEKPRTGSPPGARCSTQTLYHRKRRAIRGKRKGGKRKGKGATENPLRPTLTTSAGQKTFTHRIYWKKEEKEEGDTFPLICSTTVQLGKRGGRGVFFSFFQGGGGVLLPRPACRMKNHGEKKKASEGLGFFDRETTCRKNNQ